MPSPVLLPLTSLICDSLRSLLRLVGTVCDLKGAQSQSEIEISALVCDEFAPFLVSEVYANIVAFREYSVSMGHSATSSCRS